MDITNFKNYLDNAGLEKKRHQYIGVKWCLKKELYGNLCDKKVVRGGLIADEMGLGKTIQIIGTMVCNKKRTLIVLPRCLLEQWCKIIKETTNLSLLIFHGKKREQNINIILEYDIIITTYKLIQIDKYNNKSELHNIKWERIIFDEAHHIRNKNTNIFKGALKLKSKIRWLLSGTPIQNSKKDFYNLCEQIGINNKYYLNPNNLNNIINYFILKRKIQDINLYLPIINKYEIMVKWETEEEKILANVVHDIIKNNFELENKIGHLAIMIKAKQLCIYPKLVKNKLNFLILNNKINKEFILKAINNSSKLNKVVEIILKRKNNNNNKLIFCTFREEIDELENRLKNNNFIVEKFDGRTKEKDRIKILENRTINILILQIQTGCEGLNLQRFNEVYFVSSHWNPAIEEQAIARVYRIGQEKETFIYKFTMENFDKENINISIEQYIKNIQESKKKLINIICKNNE